MERAAALVLYDETCRLCTITAAALARRGLRVAPIGSRVGETWLRDLDRRQRYSAFHAIDPAGRRYSGGGAVPLALAAVRGGRILAVAARRLPRLTELAYLAVARNRSTLSRLVAGACRARRLRRASRARAD